MSKPTANLPHKVGSAEIASPELKKVAMLFMENFLALGRQISDLQSAVREVASRPVVSPEIEDIENYVSRAETAASTATSAKNAAVDAKELAVPAAQTATTKAGEALASAQNAATSESNASGYATSASQAASRAEAAAASASTAVWSTAFAISNLGFANTNANYRRFYLSGFVPDATKQYLVTATFHQDSNATSGTTETACGIAVGNGAGEEPVGEGASLFPLDETKTTHKKVSVKPTEKKKSCSISISGEDAFFQITNSGTAAIGIVVKIALVAQGG